ncbi:MAG TPA: alpha/beta fold hydrolase [Steroidobacteraceae bacterium]|nr:alpha/beta fold hydrolase [Steroidobacteraceae bacterium]
MGPSGYRRPSRTSISNPRRRCSVGGSSGATPDTIEAMAEDLRHFLTALDVKSLDVLGFSIGGTIAQSLVLQYPELALSDIDLVHGIISINKARVSGVDRDKTKTSEDRRVQLCPRALSVLRRHLRLRASLKAAGKIDHDHVFFLETGALFRSLHHPQGKRVALAPGAVRM